MKQKRWVYTIDKAALPADRAELGGKGAGLVEMHRSLGLRVPPAIIITTDACRWWFENNGSLPKSLWLQLDAGIKWLEVQSGCKFGDKETPLLLSVRSGAPVSMPGMMDTLLNLGANSGQLPIEIQTKEFKMYREIVMQGNHTKIIPEDPHERLKETVKAVFNSWLNPRAVHYRYMYDIPEHLGTAVVIQQMVLGVGENSATGVCFTRNPQTGRNELYGEFLLNAQGEDLVDGSHTPRPITELEALWPDKYKELNQIAVVLEKHYKEMQDFEWTIQDGVLYVLQTRNGKREAEAACQIAIDMCSEGLISSEVAIRRVFGLGGGLRVEKKLKDAVQPIAKGIGASGGIVSGRVATDWRMAIKMTQEGLKAILVSKETTADDLAGMEVAVGFLTFTGGATSHAAVVARAMNKVAVVGAGEIPVKEGQWITLNGKTGEVFDGDVIAA